MQSVQGNRNLDTSSTRKQGWYQLGWWRRGNGEGNGVISKMSRASCDLGKKKALEAEQTLEGFLAAVKNHLSSFFLCKDAVLAIGNVITNDNKGIKLLLRSGGVAAAIKVKEQWPDHDDIQQAVKKLMIPLLKELNTSMAF
jgi:hypothetical protein